MRKKILLLLFICTAFSTFSQEETADKKITTFYFINNAEKKPVTEDQKDPYLTPEGVERAKKWSTLLSNVKLDAVYADNSISIKQTAQLAAEIQKTNIYALDTEAMYDIGFKYNTDGKNILIVSDSATTIKFANLILGEEKFTSLETVSFGNLYIVTIIENHKTGILLTVD